MVGSRARRVTVPAPRHYPLEASGPRGRGSAGTARCSDRLGENGQVPSVASLSVDEILDVLSSGAAVPLLAGLAVTQLDHALQTASFLARTRPGDEDLAVAGLVHDLGHLFPGGTDELHAEVAAEAVAPALGERVARAVALHVEAKRYLVAVDDAYCDVLRADSVASLAHQGGAMSEAEVAAFAARAGAADAVELRRADDRAKVDGLHAGGLGDWAPVLRRVALSGG